MHRHDGKSEERRPGRTKVRRSERGPSFRARRATSERLPLGSWKALRRPSNVVTPEHFHKKKCVLQSQTEYLPSSTTWSSRDGSVASSGRKLRHTSQEHVMREGSPRPTVPAKFAARRAGLFQD